MNEKELSLQIPKSRIYIFVWVCLLVLTASTVAIARMRLTENAVIIAIFIATLKSSLVLTFFMHLKDEPLILKVMLFIALFALTLIVLLTFSDIWFRYR